MNSQKNILVVTKDNAQGAERLGRVVLQWLRSRGHRAVILSSGHDSPHYADPDLDLIVVLGGDGTIISVARRVIGRRVPLVCINFGRVGFLSDLEPDDWETELEALLQTDEYRSVSALEWSLTRRGHRIAGGVAVNDVVLNRAALARLVWADIYADGEHLGAVRADGFLLSTPVGSTGYSMSAGGPILSPELDGTVFVPICPFLNIIPPMVFPCSTVFHFDLRPGTTESYVTVDGQQGHLMQSNDRLEVRGIPDAVRFQGKGLSFIRRLRDRSFVLKTPVERGRDTRVDEDE